jgi:hypothetical protein
MKALQIKMNKRAKILGCEGTHNKILERQNISKIRGIK